MSVERIDDVPPSGITPETPIAHTRSSGAASACLKCSYDLCGLPDGMCPECGHAFTHAGLNASHNTRKSNVENFARCARVGVVFVAGGRLLISQPPQAHLLSICCILVGIWLLAWWERLRARSTAGLRAGRASSGVYLIAAVVYGLLAAFIITPVSHPLGAAMASASLAGAGIAAGRWWQGDDAMWNRSALLIASALPLTLLGIVAAGASTHPFRWTELNWWATVLNPNSHPITNAQAQWLGVAALVVSAVILVYGIRLWIRSAANA